MRFLFAIVFLVSIALRVDAAQRIALIRDAEIEETLSMYAAPLLKAAGLSEKSVNLHLVHSKDLNAFVSGGANLFIHTGLIEKTGNVEELLGVMAHEIGHIRAGHLIGLVDAMKDARNTSLLGIALGALASLATGDASGIVAVGAGMGMAAQRGILAHTRTQESSADQAALKFLRKVGVAPRGFYTFLKKIDEQTLVKRKDQDPYLQTHPLTEQRMRVIKSALDRNPYPSTYPQHWDKAHKRMVAKVRAFLNPPQKTFRTYKSTDKTLEGRYARAIALSIKVKVLQALEVLNGLIKENPKDAFFHELKGEILFKNGRIGEAVDAYLKAVAIKPHNTLLKMHAAQVLLESRDTKHYQKAKDFLLFAEHAEKDQSFFWYLMSKAFAKLGDMPLSFYALAERSVAEKKMRDAKFHLQRALKGVSKTSRYYTRLLDLKMQLGYQEKEDKKNGR